VRAQDGGTSQEVHDNNRIARRLFDLVKGFEVTLDGDCEVYFELIYWGFLG